MEWTEPRYGRAQVDGAGSALRGGFRGANREAFLGALGVLDNWRASHAFPLNTFQVVLRGRAREFDPHPLIAQRLKRIPSIIAKLRRQPTMRLSQMQDIGGCRGVVHTLPQLRKLRAAYAKRSTAAVFVNLKDYVAAPPHSGYRSIHLIYRYQSSRNPERAVFNGHLIEIQLRTQLQHAWATAVETVGTLTDQALKSSEGSAQWLALFRMISGLFAFEEGTTPVPNLPARSALRRLVRAEARKLNMVERLRAFRNALNVLNEERTRDARYFLLRLNALDESLVIRPYRLGEIEEATEEYLAAERDAATQSGVDVVLVRADSIDSLQRAYPNYFLDTEHFLEKFTEITAPKPRARAG